MYMSYDQRTQKSPVEAGQAGDGPSLAASGQVDVGRGRELAFPPPGSCRLFVWRKAPRRNQVRAVAALEKVVVCVCLCG